MRTYVKSSHEVATVKVLVTNTLRAEGTVRMLFRSCRYDHQIFFFFACVGTYGYVYVGLGGPRKPRGGSRYPM